MTETSANGRRERELAYRITEEVEVSLRWDPSDDRLTVAVTNRRTGNGFELLAKSDDALDVFHHPHAYAARRVVRHAVGRASGVRA